MNANLPDGTVTFLFTDIEGSSKLWENFPEAMQPALARHDALLREAIETQGGVVFKTVGDGTYAAFSTAPEAFAAALTAQKALNSLALNISAGPAHNTQPPIPIRVRMALHTGMAERRDNDYFGAALNRVARLLSAGHGGQVLCSAPAQELARDYLPTLAALRDLGEIRLRDLSRPERVFQLLHPELPDDFPALKSLDNPAYPNNLPQQLTSLIGREKESGDVVRLLQNSRLVTLVGAGGCGKTRLALQAAADLLENSPDGVWFVEFAPLTDAALVPQTVAQALKAPEEPGKATLQTLIERLKAKEIVVLLDNCEHVLSAAAVLTDALLRALPQIRLLATSREPLNITGETVYRVPSLSLPDPQQTQTPESLSQYEAVQLFIDRALAVAPNFVVTNANAPALAAICHRLDGIPLALELAAARSRSMPLEQIAARLDNRFQLLTGGSRASLPRQQTLRALIDWSFSLLTESEQELLRRLSIFSGGWTLEAAEAICAGIGAEGTGNREWGARRRLEWGARRRLEQETERNAAIQNDLTPDTQRPIPIEDWEILDLLTSLADKSLVAYAERDGAARYRLLETVKQYAGDRLAERGGDFLRECHRDYYLTLAKQSQPQGQDALRDLAILEAEHDNIRAALTASFGAPGSVEQMLESMRPLGAFRRIRGYYSEARDSLQAALAAPGKGPTAARASALIAALFINMAMGNYEEARRQIEESVAIQRGLNEPQKLSNALMSYGNLLVEIGDFAAGKRILEEGMALSLAQGDSGMGFYGNLGVALLYAGEHEQAEPILAREAALNRQAGIKEWEATALYNLARVALARADGDAARSHLTTSLTICCELDYRPGLLYVFFGFSLLAAAQRQVERAACLLGAHDTLRERLASLLFPAEQPEYDRQIAALRAALGQETFDAAYESGRALDWSQAIALAKES